MYIFLYIPHSNLYATGCVYIQVYIYSVIANTAQD